MGKFNLGHIFGNIKDAVETGLKYTPPYLAYKLADKALNRGIPEKIIDKGADVIISGQKTIGAVVEKGEDTILGISKTLALPLGLGLGAALLIFLLIYLKR